VQIAGQVSGINFAAALWLLLVQRNVTSECL